MSNIREYAAKVKIWDDEGDERVGDVTPQGDGHGHRGNRETSVKQPTVDEQQEESERDEL